MPQIEFKTSRSQLLRMRRALLAALASLAFLLLCWLAFFLERLAIPVQTMWLLTLLQCVGSVVVIGLIWSNLNLRFNDPSLTMLQIVWAIAVVFITAYFAGDLRTLFLTMLLLVVMFGAFRLDRGGFALIGAFSLLCYLLLFAVVRRQEPNFDAESAFIHAVGFFILLLGVSLLGLEIGRMRLALQRRNRDLRKALEHIQQLAINDPLTGLYNQRFAQDLLAQQQALSDRGGYSFSLCLLAFDGLKPSLAGEEPSAADQFLQTLAQLLREELRDVDFIARYRLDEFLLILSRVDEMAAQQLCERLCNSVQALLQEQPFDVQVCTGVAAYQEQTSWQQTLERTEEALRAARLKG